MTNSSPQDPQNPIPERRQKPAAGVTFDEMIAIIVAFSTIGALLFWTLGGRKGGIASNFGLGENNSILSSDKTTATGFGLGNLGSDRQDSSAAAKREDREIAARLRESESPVVFVPPTSVEPELRGKAKEPSYQFNSGAKLVPLAGVAALPALNSSAAKKPQTPIVKQPDVVEKPQAPVVEQPDVIEKPQADAPKKAEMPDDISPEYWAYPFVKQMSGKGLVPDFSDDQNFEPDKLITRAGMATLVSQAFDYKTKNEDVKQFRDVPDDNAISADINEAVRTGFMQGYSENTFRPLENIPRYQVLVTLATGLDLKPSGDPDQILQKLDGGTDIPDWAKEQVAAAAESGLIVNRPEFANNSLNSNESATRGEVAAMIHQALVKTGKLNSIDSEYIFKP